MTRPGGGCGRITVVVVREDRLQLDRGWRRILHLVVVFLLVVIVVVFVDDLVLAVGDIVAADNRARLMLPSARKLRRHVLSSVRADRNGLPKTLWVGPLEMSSGHLQRPGRWWKWRSPRRCWRWRSPRRCWR
jgi:hypothetical protein